MGAVVHVKKRVEELHEQERELQRQITELEKRPATPVLSTPRLDQMRQRFLALGDCVEDMTLEQKRAALRTIVQKVVWDGQHVHVVLAGAEEPPMRAEAGSLAHELERRNTAGVPVSLSKRTRLGEDSK